MNRILILLLVIPCISNADIVETWTCTERFASEILAVAYVDTGRETGSIKVAGVVHDAKFRTKGFERRWDFGLVSDFSYHYAFIIRPNGDASYYDFSSSEAGETVKSSIFMKCKQK